MRHRMINIEREKYNVRKKCNITYLLKKIV